MLLALVINEADAYLSRTTPEDAQPDERDDAAGDYRVWARSIRHDGHDKGI